MGLLKRDGMLGMIVPNKFMTIKNGKAMRALLSGKYHVARIIDFGTLQVFSGRSTYTCILLATPENLNEFTRQFVTSLPAFVDDPLGGGLVYPESDLTSDAWSFLPEAISIHMDAIGQRCTKLSDLANIFVGLQTSNDTAYIIDPIEDLSLIHI